MRACFKTRGDDVLRWKRRRPLPNGAQIQKGQSTSSGLFAWRLHSIRLTSAALAARTTNEAALPGGRGPGLVCVPLSFVPAADAAAATGARLPCDFSFLTWCFFGALAAAAGAAAS